MTTPPDANSVVPQSPAGPRTVHLALTGDLDYDTCGELLLQVRAALHDCEEAENLRMDCQELGVVDSMGLSTLLQIHRSACGKGISFHLLNIGPALERLLRLTGTFDHLTAPGPVPPPLA
ncbi:STAS domain-containing protein [Streptomyces sp. NPDC054887]